MTSAPPLEAPLLEVKGLGVRYGDFQAVSDVSFDIARGETVALLGESGSGKTTVGRAVLRLVPASSGVVRYEGADVAPLRGAALTGYRRRVQPVFQDPMGALDPRWTIGALVTEGLLVHGLARRGELPARAAALLSQVGLEPALATRYPHELSGGQRQRVGIARALALEPSLMVCDECVSALDVSVQAQVLNLLRDLQDAKGIAMLFIAHDLAVVRHMAARVAVLSGGRIVEAGRASDVLERPAHPYTRRLLEAEPSLRRGRARPIIPAATT